VTVPGGVVFGLGLANAIGMTVTGLMLVVAVRRHAGRAALAGLGRALVAASAASAAAGAAGWAVVTAVEPASGPTPGVLGSVVEGMLGGVTVAVVFLAVAFVLDRRDLGPLVGTLWKRLRR
jgi:putative peptidoglycan lipid II flippase